MSSASNAKTHAMSAQSARTVEEKLNYLAKALVDLIKMVDDIDTDVRRIKNK